MSLDLALTKTALYDFHIKHQAKMVPFAGYAMPVQYPRGVLKEHLFTREYAGLFDVSHMGQLLVEGKDSAAFLESLMPSDLKGLADGEMRYCLLTNEQGGIIDDLIVTRMQDAYLLVINAACKQKDYEHISARKPADIDIRTLSTQSLLALQGPCARKVLVQLIDGVDALTFMHSRKFSYAGRELVVSCSGYTGEDGFEVSLPNDIAEDFAERLLADPVVGLIGLGARDSLRLEAGLCLYGQDLNEQTTPVESGISWAISAVRRAGGERAGGYPGAAIIDKQLTEGVARKRVLIKPDGKAPVRAGALIVNENGDSCGEVCSGGFGPSVSAPIAMANIDSQWLASGKPLFVALRKALIPVAIQKSNFIPAKYFRG